MLPLFFPVCKFFDSEVHVAMGFLTRPVTGHESHHNPGHHEQCHGYEYGLDHATSI